MLADLLEMEDRKDSAGDSKYRSQTGPTTVPELYAAITANRSFEDESAFVKEFFGVEHMSSYVHCKACQMNDPTNSCTEPFKMRIGKSNWDEEPAVHLKLVHFISFGRWKLEKTKNESEPIQSRNLLKISGSGSPATLSKGKDHNAFLAFTGMATLTFALSIVVVVASSTDWGISCCIPSSCTTAEKLAAVPNIGGACVLSAAESAIAGCPAPLDIVATTQRCRLTDTDACTSTFYYKGLD